MKLSRRGFIAGIAACFAAAKVGVPLSVAMPVATSLTCISGILKAYYPTGSIEQALYAESPLFALMPKTDFGGAR